jgi:hypothetical protein
LSLGAALVFDHPTPAMLAAHLTGELAPSAASAIDPEEAAVRRLLATVPMARLRQSGLLDLLLRLDDPAAEDSKDDSTDDSKDDSIDDMDVESLLRLATESAAG